MTRGDEASVAGLKHATENNTNYLYTNQIYWTMSPYVVSASNANVWHIGSIGNFNGDSVYSERGVRGVINIKPSTSITGSGTSLDPYIVI